jgi:hypothetical protein
VTGPVCFGEDEWQAARQDAATVQHAVEGGSQRQCAGPVGFLDLADEVAADVHGCSEVTLRQSTRQT